MVQKFLAFHIIMEGCVEDCRAMLPAARPLGRQKVILNYLSCSASRKQNMFLCDDSILAVFLSTLLYVNVCCGYDCMPVVFPITEVAVSLICCRSAAPVIVSGA